jgi:hypothetical protein
MKKGTNVNGNGKNTFEISVSIFIFITMIFDLAQAKIDRSGAEKQCIQANTYWDTILTPKDVLGKNSSICTSISDDCCYMNIQYQYGPVPFDNSYCFTMTGNFSSWKNKFSNLFTDDLMWYANYQYESYEDYTIIGNNLHYKLYENYTCWEQHPVSDFSWYNTSICALFNSDGSCAILNDDSKFSGFVTNMYQNISVDYCHNYKDDGSCLNYDDPVISNNTALNPLMDRLITSLTPNSTKSASLQNSTQNSFWKLPCKPIPKIIVDIVCSPNYSSSNYLKSSLDSLSFLFLIIVFLL